MIGASSYHPGGVNVGFLDGSVKFIKDSVSLQTWAPSPPRRGARSSTPAAIEPETPERNTRFQPDSDFVFNGGVPCRAVLARWALPLTPAWPFRTSPTPISAAPAGRWAGPRLSRQRRVVLKARV